MSVSRSAAARTTTAAVYSTRYRLCASEVRQVAPVEMSRSWTAADDGRPSTTVSMPTRNHVTALSGWSCNSAGATSQPIAATGSRTSRAIRQVLSIRRRRLTSRTSIDAAYGTPSQSAQPVSCTGTITAAKSPRPSSPSARLTNGPVRTLSPKIAVSVMPGPRKSGRSRRARQVATGATSPRWSSSMCGLRRPGCERGPEGRAGEQRHRAAGDHLGEQVLEQRFATPVVPGG